MTTKLKIGVIYCAYNTKDLCIQSLPPWTFARDQHPDGHEFVICAVNTPFVGFDNETPDQTRFFLEGNLTLKLIDHLITSDVPMAETEARTKALVWLKEQGVDAVIQVDSDEQYTLDEIRRIFAFVAANPFIQWFRLSLKNFVFNDKTYLLDPFTPPRIHRIRFKVGVLTFEASCFLQDNDIGYVGGLTRDAKVQGQFASLTVPQSVAWVRHMSWLSDDRSRRKVAYQQARGWNCSFAWDDAKGCLVWNGPAQETATDE